VIILEESHYDLPRVGETLSPSIQKLLLELDVWESFLSLRATPSNGVVSSWGGSDLQSSSFIFNPYGQGWHVDRRRFDTMLADAAAQAGVCVHTGIGVKRCDWHLGRGWELETRARNIKVGNDESSSTRYFSAHALINATGRKSAFTGRWVHDRLIGLAALFQAQNDEAGFFTLIEATENGWWYSAPLPGERLMVMFMTDADLIAKQRLIQLTTWQENLGMAKHTATRCQGCKLLETPRGYPALSHRLRRPISAAKWLAVGDAALAVDPLSGNGIARALRSGSEAAQAMNRWLTGDHSAAVQYEMKRDEEFNDYLQRKRDFYAMEARWPGAPFWQRRIAKHFSVTPLQSI
jgi:flavin-dependent dehydrogenase